MRALPALRKCVSKSSETLTETRNVWPEKNDLIQTDCVTDQLVCSCPRFTRRPQQGGLGSHEAGQRCRGGVDKPVQCDAEVCCQPGCSWRRWRYSHHARRKTNSDSCHHKQAGCVNGPVCRSKWHLAVVMLQIPSNWKPLVSLTVAVKLWEIWKSLSRAIVWFKFGLQQKRGGLWKRYRSLCRNKKYKAYKNTIII